MVTRCSCRSRDEMIGSVLPHQPEGPRPRHFVRERGWSQMRRRTLVFCLAVAMMAIGTGGAQAREPVTFGDVQAQFEAAESGGGVIITKKGLETAIPPASPLLHSIRPIKAFFDGRHYCTLDWHLITIALFGTPDEFGLSTQEFKAFLGATTITFKLDGTAIPAAESTAVKTSFFELFGSVPGETFWRAWGNFYAPGVLPVGAHSLTGWGTDPLGTFKLDRITFYIDPAGSGACL